jgi:hypothetical protein
MGVKAEGMSMLVAVVGRMELERAGRTESERTDPAAVEPAEAGHTGFAYSGPVCMKEFGRTGSAVADCVEFARTGSACSGLACTKVGCIGLGRVSLEFGCIGSAVGAAPLEPAGSDLLVACWIPAWGPFCGLGGGGGSVFCSCGCGCTWWASGGSRGFIILFVVGC